MVKKLKDYYNSEIRPALQKELKIKNIHAIPSLEKVVINVGVGEVVQNKKVIDKVAADLELITGQKAVIAQARKSVAAFKIRKGLPIGAKVTLRDERMYDFVEKLFKVVLPRIRDFRGIPATSFDQHGNLNIGMSDQTLFPEIDYDKIDKIRGLEITLVTTTKDVSQARVLFEKLGLKFQEEEND